VSNNAAQPLCGHRKGVVFCPLLNRVSLPHERDECGHCCEAEASDEEGGPDLGLGIILFGECIAQCGPAVVWSQEWQSVLSSLESGVTTA